MKEISGMFHCIISNICTNHSNEEISIELLAHPEMVKVENPLNKKAMIHLYFLRLWKRFNYNQTIK